MEAESAPQEMVIFTRTFEFLGWLMPLTNRFPKTQRFLVTARLLNAAFDLREELDRANLRRGRERAEALQRADECLGRIDDRLSRHRLTAHPGAHPRPVTEGVPFLGFITFPSHRRIKNRKARHFHRKYRRLRDEARRGEIPWETVTASVRGWVNHAAFGDTWRLREAILGDP